MRNEFFDSPPSSSLVALLRDLVGRANTAVHDQTLLPEYRGKRMSTTVVACAIRGDEAVAAHVGDSRLYQIRGSEIVFLGGDQTPENGKSNAQSLIDSEQPPSEMQHAPNRSLGLSSSVHVNTTTLPVLTGDCFVLCTGGVYKAMYDDEIVRLAATKNSPQLIAEEIVRYAVEVDGSDNATAQVISIESIENTRTYGSSRYHLANP
jgi:serine/threonine protein phosphatase PrpC